MVQVEPVPFVRAVAEIACDAAILERIVHRPVKRFGCGGYVWRDRRSEGQRLGDQ
jgi:hypothetical protein